MEHDAEGPKSSELNFKDFSEAVTHLREPQSSDSLFTEAISRNKVLSQEKDERGDTLLHVAAQGGRLNACVGLLANGARAGVRNNMGENAAHVAFKYSKTECASTILDAIEESRAKQSWYF